VATLRLLRAVNAATPTGTEDDKPRERRQEDDGREQH
jgi:hypothetical protein